MKFQKAGGKDNVQSSSQFLQTTNKLATAKFTSHSGDMVIEKQRKSIRGVTLASCTGETGLSDAAKALDWWTER